MENLILLHKLDVQNISKLRAQQLLAQYVAQTKDTFRELKKIKVTNIFLPNKEGINDVQVLYPLPQIISNDPINVAKMNEVVDAINNLVNNKEKIIVE